MANTYIFANNAGSTLAGSISNTALSLNLQAGGGALFPNPTTGQIFTITAIDAATGLLREIMWCTAKSSDTLTIVRAQEGTTALAWNAGDLIQELWTAGQAGAMVQSSGAGTTFVAIVPQTTFFVDNTTGSNTTGNGLTSGTAWATIQFAVSQLSTYNLNGNKVTIQLGTVGTYSGNLFINSPGNGTLVIRGNPAAQSTYTISATPAAGTGVVNVGSGSVSLVGVTVSNVSGGATTTCILCSTSALSLQNVTVFATVTGTLALISASVSGAITLLAGNIIAGGAASCLSIASGGSIIQANNVTVTGTPSFTTAFCTAQILGIFALPGTGPIWVGSAAGPRYLSTLNSVIDTLGGGATFFPGNSAGTATTGLYV